MIFINLGKNKNIMNNSAGGSKSEPAEKRAKTDSIHPSWAAKQTQKSSIQIFAGKKTVFGDSGDQNQASKHTSVKNVPAVHSKPVIRSKPVISNEVHPSWAAKQAQKPSIQPFLGKKITFGDD